MRGWSTPALAVALGAALVAPGHVAADGPSVRSGPLTAHVDGAGALRLLQRGGATLRQERGFLRFHTNGHSMPASRLVGRRRIHDGLALTLAVGRGHRAELRLERRASGVLALRVRLLGDPRVDAVSMAFRAPPGERYFGFGERSNAVAQRATRVENYVSDGPFSVGSRAVAEGTIPPAGFRARADATYYPVPWLLSGRGYGVLVANDETSSFRLPVVHGGTWGLKVAAAELRLLLFAGPTPAAALRRFTRATGRQPAPVAPWAFGPWLQTGQPNAPPLSDQMADLNKLRAADAPVSAAETQLRYLPCGLDRGLEEYEARRVAYYHAAGLAVLTYVNPMLCASYEPRFSSAAASGALLKTSGEPSLFDSFVGGTGAAGFTIQKVGAYDFTAAAGTRAYGEVIDRILAAAHDGWMEDFGEYTPLDAVSADGRTGSALHNLYPALYHCAVHRMTTGRTVVRFQRSGWTGAARCADDVWGGDPTTTFGFDGLSSAVRQALSIGLSGVSRWGSDIGGYDTIGADPKLTPELLKRWIQFGAVSGVMRIKKSGLEIPPYARPQVWDPSVIGVWRRYAKLHTQLYPYIAAADRRYRSTGMPLMRALVLHYPHDRRAAGVDDEFLFGSHLLAAPVIEPSVRSRSVYLPPGHWLSGRNALRYDGQGDGAFHVGAARPLRGGRIVRVRAGLRELPLYVRHGAVIPMLSPDVSTLSRYGRGDVVRLTDRRDRLRLLAFPGPSSTAGMFSRERLSSRTTPGRWTLRIDGRRTRRYTVEASTAGLHRRDGRGAFRACSIIVGGRSLPRSAWNQRRPGVLVAVFSARRTVMVARSC
jgi:alpha-glucosidase (family GH31 glycosyl hydrolase)